MLADKLLRLRLRLPLRLLAACTAAALAGACSTPCDAPGRLCAPISSITSGAAPQPAAAPTSTAAATPAPPPAAVAFAVTMPGTDASASPAAGSEARTGVADALPLEHPVRIALLLPLHSETLGQAADAVKDGFMAAWERDRDRIAVSVVDTGEVPQDVLSSYAHALEQQDIVVGPLARSAVAAVAASPLVSKPTIALNYPEGYGTAGAAPLPPHMLAMGLSIEEEARQAAQWAASEHPSSSALILSTSTPWQRRVAAAFAAQWQRLGLAVKTVELSALNGYLSDPELVQLRARIQADKPGLLFSAMGADQTRQLRGALSDVAAGGPAAAQAAQGTQVSNPGAVASPAGEPVQTAPAAPASFLFGSLPIYGTSALNPGNGSNSPTQELDGVRLLDLPWQVQRDHPAVMVYPRPLQAAERKPGAADMERLYALGIDAYRVAREIARHEVARFRLDGVTGRLSVSFGQGEAHFERIEQAAVYKNGVALPVPQSAAPATPATPQPVAR